MRLFQGSVNEQGSESMTLVFYPLTLLMLGITGEKSRDPKLA